MSQDFQAIGNSLFSSTGQLIERTNFASSLWIVRPISFLCPRRQGYALSALTTTASFFILEITILSWQPFLPSSHLIKERNPPADLSARFLQSSLLLPPNFLRKLSALHSFVSPGLLNSPSSGSSTSSRFIPIIFPICFLSSVSLPPLASRKAKP